MNNLKFSKDNLFERLETYILYRFLDCNQNLCCNQNLWPAAHRKKFIQPRILTELIYALRHEILEENIEN